jgi:succinate dehydrogenase/fumarate reductase-like Fe-S protein
MDLTLRFGARPARRPLVSSRRTRPRIDEHRASFLEMLDQVNEQLIGAGEEPIAFDHDCREGSAASCGLMINGQAHGPLRGAPRCARCTCATTATAT